MFSLLLPAATTDSGDIQQQRFHGITDGTEFVYHLLIPQKFIRLPQPFIQADLYYGE